MPDADHRARRLLTAGTRVVVTGGEGFLGARVVRRLVELGCAVVSLDRRRRSDDDGTHDVIETDVRDRDGVAEAVSATSPSVVFHLAALHFIPACIADPVSTLEINVVGTQLVLDACATLPSPPTVVFASTADVYLPSAEPLSEQAPIGPNNVYGLSKLTGEGLVRFAGVRGDVEPVTCRLFNLYGSRETNPHVIPEIVEQLKVGDQVTLGNRAPKRDFVYVDDAAAALVALAGDAPSGTVVNVGTGRSHSVDDVLEAIATLTGRQLRVATDQARWRASDRANLQCDNALLRSLVPSAATTSLVDGLRALLTDEGLLQ